MASVSVVNYSGRIFNKSSKISRNGLLITITYSTSEKDANQSKQNIFKSVKAKGVTFNDVGDQFWVSDTRGSIINYYIDQNRYSWIEKQTKTNGTMAFVSNPKNESLIASNSDFTASVYGIKGKLLHTFRGHRSVIDKFGMNTKQRLIMTKSKDVINLWDREKYSKVKSLFPQEWKFIDGCFSSDGLKICALTDQNKVLIWNVGNYDLLMKGYELSKNISFKCIDCSTKYMVWGGKNPFLVMLDVDDYFTNKNINESIFRLPEEFENGVEKIQFIRRNRNEEFDRTSLAILTKGQLIVLEVPSDETTVEDSKTQETPRKRLKIVMTIKIPHVMIQNFDIDRNGKYASLLTSEGDVRIYDLDVVEENQKGMAYQRLYWISKEEYESFASDVTYVDSNIYILQNAQLHESSQSSANKENVQLFSNSVNWTYENSKINKKIMDIEESKICSSTNQNDIDESDINNVDEFLKENQQQSAINVITNGQSTVDGTQRQQNRTQVNDQIPTRDTISSAGSTFKRATQEAKPIKIDSIYCPTYGSAMMNIDMSEFKYDKLLFVLKKYNEYPEKYRSIIWRQLLGLPLRKIEFEFYILKDPHPAFHETYKKIAVKSSTTYNKVVRFWSALSYWCPLFAEIDYLPELVLPFILTIKNDDLILFEVLIWFLMQFCQFWFERYPSDPIHLLKTSIEPLLRKEYPSIVNHFEELNVWLSEFTWMIVRNAFSKVLYHNDWLKLFDHLLSNCNKPELIYYFWAAFMGSISSKLLKASSKDQLEEVISSKHKVDIISLIKNMFKLYIKYASDDEIFVGMTENHIPLLGENCYPSFYNYPSESVAYAQKIRSARLNQEQLAEQKEQELNGLRDNISKILIRDKQQREQSKVIAQNELNIFQKEKSLLETQIIQKLREQDERAEYLRQLESTLKSSISNQEHQRQIEKQRLTYEYSERRRLAEYEHKARLHEEELRKLEHKATQRVLEMITIREKEDYQRQISLEVNHRIKEEEARDRALMEKWKLEDEERKLRTEIQISEKNRQREVHLFTYDRQRVEMEHKLHELEKELYVMQLEKERKLRQIEEDYVQTSNQMKLEMGRKHDLIEMMEKTGLAAYEVKTRELCAKSDEKIKEIQRQKEQIEGALEAEKEEQKRLERAIEKKSFEEEIMKIKLIEDAKRKEQEMHIESIQKQMDAEQKERYNLNNQLYFKEKELIEKEKFNELLINTDDNLRKMEEDQMIKENMKLKISVDNAIVKAREQRENKLREIVRDRELNFQEYTVKRHNQIKEEYNNKIQENKHEFEEISVISESPYKEQPSVKKNQSFKENRVGDVENTSPNQRIISPSEFSNSINQKYLNKDVYESYKKGYQQPNYNQEFAKRNGIMIQSYPLSDQINGSRAEMNYDEEQSQSHDENSEYTSQDENSVIQRHENTKNAFEIYK